MASYDACKMDRAATTGVQLFFSQCRSRDVSLLVVRHNPDWELVAFRP